MTRQRSGEGQSRQSTLMYLPQAKSVFANIPAVQKQWDGDQNPPLVHVGFQYYNYMCLMSVTHVLRLAFLAPNVVDAILVAWARSHVDGRRLIATGSISPVRDDQVRAMVSKDGR